MNCYIIQDKTWYGMNDQIDKWLSEHQYEDIISMVTTYSKGNNWITTITYK